MSSEKSETPIENTAENAVTQNSESATDPNVGANGSKQNVHEQDHAEQKWNGRSRGGHFGTWFFVMLIKHLGLRAAYTFLCFVVPYFVLFAPKATRSTWNYCRRARQLGRWHSFVEVFAIYYNFGQCIIDKIAIGQGQSHLFNFVFDDEAQVRELLSSQNPAIVLSGHIGTWESGSATFSQFGKKMNVTIFDNESASVKQAIEREQQDRSFHFIPIGRDWLDGIIEIKNALGRGEFVCFMGDRYMSGSPTNVVEFMGLPTRFTRGPFEVAAVMRVPVVFYFAMREPNKTYHFHFYMLKPEGSRRAMTDLIQSEYVRRLEQMVRQYPRQWFNFFDYFDTESQTQETK